MDMIETVIIGLGNIGCGYDYEIPFIFNDPKSSKCILTHARAIACHPNFKLICGIDKDPEACRLYSNNYKSPSFKNIAEWSESKDFKNPNLAIIAVPPNYQKDVLRELFNICEPKMLLLEKPIASNLKDLKIIKKIIRNINHTDIFINYIRCYLPAVKELKTIIDSNKLGQFIHGNITYGKGLLNNASHFINLAELLLGEFTFLNKGKITSKCLGYDNEINITLSALNFSNALLNVVSISKLGLVAGEIDLWFDHGRILWPNNGDHIFIWYAEKEKSIDGYLRLSNNPKTISTDMKSYQIHVLNFLNDFYNKQSIKNLSCSLNSGLKTLELLLNIQT